MLLIFLWWLSAVASSSATVWSELDPPYCAVRYRRLCQGKGRHVGCQFPTSEPGESCRNYTMIKFTKELRHFITHYINRRRHRIASGSERVRGGAHLPQPEVMLHVEWDKELSLLAQRLADQCNFVHDDCRATVRYPYSGQTVGEVKWRRTSESDQQNVARAIRRVLDAWWGEKRRVTVRQMTQPFRLTSKGNVWGHFSQLAVWTLRAVGCGAVRHGNRYPRILLVCDFSHTNMLGQRTIVPGSLAPCPIHMIRKQRSPYPLLCSTVRQPSQQIESPHHESPPKLAKPINYELNDDPPEDDEDDDYEDSFVNVSPNTTITSKATSTRYHTTYTTEITRKRLKLPSWMVKDIADNAKPNNNRQSERTYNIKRIQKGKSNEKVNDDENENVPNIDKSKRVYEIKRISDRKKTQEKVLQIEGDRTPETEKAFDSESITERQRQTSRETTETRYLMAIEGKQKQLNKEHEFEQIMFKAASKYRPTKPEPTERVEQEEEREAEDINSPIAFYEATESHRKIFLSKDWPKEETRNLLMQFRSTAAEEPRTQDYEPVRHRWRPTKDRPQRPGALALITSTRIRLFTAAKAPVKQNVVTQPSLKIDTDDLEQFFKDTGFKAKWRQQKKMMS